MSYSYTLSETQSFTVTHARHIAAKVATDLKRMQRFYGKPNDNDIADYESEVIELLKAGYLGTVTYGFRNNSNEWIEPTLIYTAKEFSLSLDDDPGRVKHNADITGAAFFSYLTYTSEWELLSPDEQLTYKKNNLPFVRNGAVEPGVNGYFENDRTYSGGGRALSRASVRSY